MRSAAWAVAHTTLLEAIRERVLYLLAGFALFVFAVSRLLAPLALGEGRRVTLDLSMMATSIVGILIVIFVGHSLIYRELERNTVVFLFSRPVGRGSFVFGKFLGLAGVLAMVVAGMAVSLGAMLAIAGYPVPSGLPGALAISLMELWIVAAAAMFFASLCSPILAGLLVVAVWGIGNSAGAIAELGAAYPSTGTVWVGKLLPWILPRLDLYDGAGWLVHAAPPSSSQWFWMVSYCLLYVAALLLLARAALARRSFAR